jgi:CBS domain containing-hemolysin-like protein
MTDFTREPPATVTEDRSIDDALEDMVFAGVHALLVVRGDLVSGLITSYDIQGDRPLILLMAPSYRRPDQIAVREIMTPWDQVPKLDWSLVNAAQVFELARAFRRMRATHLVVVQNLEYRGAFVRALISRRRLNRQLGLD